MKSKVEMLRAGDTSVITEIIEENLPLVKKLERTFQFKFPHLKDDIHSAALMGLTQGVHWAQTTLKDANIEPYLNQNIRGFIYDEISKSRLIHIPHSANLEDSKYFDKTNFVPKVFHGGKLTTQPVYVPLTDVPDDRVTDDMEELISTIGLNAREKFVVKMRVEGYTTHEIGARMGLTHVSILNVLVGVKKKCIEHGIKPSTRKILQSRKCSMCGREKSLSDYYRSGSGYKSQCKDCLKKKRENISSLSVQ